MTPWDLVVYLLLTQCLALVAWRSAAQGDSVNLERVVLAYPALLAGVWLFWGGYGVDSWRYLTAFWGERLLFESEQLFWLSGTALSHLTSDPWPVKILAALGVLALCAGIISFHRQHSRTCVIVGLALVPLLPAFFLTYGNALRQGLGATAAVLAAMFLVRGRLVPYLSLGIVAFLFHQTSPIIALAALAARFIPGLVFIALLVCPLVSFAGAYLASLYDIRLADHVRYAYYAEGAFHYLKFAVTYGVAWTLVLAGRNWSREAKTMAFGYAYLVAASSMLLKFEVPFERFVLYGDFFLPFAVPLLIVRWIEKDSVMMTAWVASLVAGILLWSHTSIVSSIGLITVASR